MCDQDLDYRKYYWKFGWAGTSITQANDPTATFEYEIVDFAYFKEDDPEPYGGAAGLAFAGGAIASALLALTF